jgi:hypothetical protein
MTGDRDNMLARLRALLPLRWFADAAPVRDALLNGLATTWASMHDMITFARRQTRIGTATGAWLDMAARDFFGARLPRRWHEADADYAARIRAALLQPRATRAALSDVLTRLTGRAPAIFEPTQPGDTGAWGMALAYGTAGGWGSLALPLQSFVTAYRPHGTGIGNVAGWGGGPGGYGVGAIEYAALAMISGQVTDAEINAAIAGTLPVTGIAWTRIVFEQS